MALHLNPSPAEFAAARSEASLTVLAGLNNSGKSLMLKNLKGHFGRNAYMVGANRFYHIHEFGSQGRDPNELNSLEQQFLLMFAQENMNQEQNFLDLQRIIVNLNDEGRKRLFGVCGDLLEATITMKKIDEDNELSMRLIDLDGQNLSVSSTGARLLLTLLGICMDARFDTILIDEPELGLSPRVQERLARFLDDPGERREYFPHLQRVVVATHSQLFLARRDIRDNFLVAKAGETISTTQVATRGEFHNLQFNLLGNSFEALFLPAAIVVVEGKTDHRYLKRLIQLRFPERRMTVVAGQGDVKRVVNGLREALGNLDVSPFHDRIFVVLDSVHQKGLQAELEKLGVRPENVVVWSRNGIEYLYPEELMADAFACPREQIGDLQIDDDIVRIGSVQRTKNTLCDEILLRLDGSTPLPGELEERLLTPLGEAVE